MNQTTTNDKPRRAHRRKWLPYLAAIALIALIVAGLWPKPVPVETARVTTGLLRSVISEEGKTRIRQRYIVSAPVGGQLQRVVLKAGAPVKAGQTVAVLEPLAPNLLDPRARAQAEARRDGARAALEKARASAEFALSELRRFEQLFKEGTISAQERESVQLRSTAAARDVASAEGFLRQAEAELAEFGRTPGDRPGIELKAPVEGRILRVFEENSRTVSAGTPIMEIGDPTNLEVVVEVLSRDGAAIEPGTPVELDQWGGRIPLQAQVRLVEPAAFTKVSALGVEEQRVNLIADVLTPPEKRESLGDNFRVEAHIIVWKDENALKVPAGALFRVRDQWSCFVVENGVATLRKVKPGLSSGTETQVLEGLKEGEEVILYPGSRIKEGQRVSRIEV